MPHTTALYNAFLNDFPRVSGFYAHTPDLAGIERSSKALRFDNTIRQAVVEVLRNQNRNFGCDEHTLRNLVRLRDGAATVDELLREHDNYIEAAHREDDRAGGEFPERLAQA